MAFSSFPFHWACDSLKFLTFFCGKSLICFLMLYCPQISFLVLYAQRPAKPKLAVACISRYLWVPSTSGLTCLSGFNLYFFNLRLFLLFSYHLSVHWKNFFFLTLYSTFLRRALQEISLPHCPNISQMLFLMFLL